MKKFAIVLAVMLGIFCLNGLAFSDTIVQNTVPKERTTFSEYEEALDHYNKGEYQKSINILKDYIRQTPDPWGYWLMGYSLYKLKRFDEANEYFKNAYLVDPSFSPTPTLEKELKGPYKPARPEGYPEGTGPSAGPTPMPKLQQGTIVITESGPVVPAEKPAAPTPVPTPAPAPEQTTQAQVPPSPAPAPTPVPAPAAPTQAAPEAVPPPAEPGAGEAPPPPAAPQAVPAPAQPEAQQQVTPPPPPAPKPTPQPAPRPKPIPRQPQQPEMPFSPEMIAGLGMTMLLVVAGIGLLVYLIFSFFVYKLAKNLNVGAPILAFIPVAQNWILAACAGTSFIVTFLLFLLQFLFAPLAFAIIFMKAAEQLGKSKGLGFILGLILPIVPLIWFAFAGGEGAAMTVGKAGGMGDMPDLSGEPDIPDLDFDLEEEPAPKAKGGAKPKEQSSYEDDWQMPEEESTGGQSVDDWQLPEEKNEGEQSVDDWQLPQDDDEFK